MFSASIKLGTKEVNGQIVPLIFGSCVVKENGTEISINGGNLYFDSIELDTSVKSPSYGGTGVANNLTTTASGKVLDARQGKTLKDAVDGKADKEIIGTINNSTKTINFSGTVKFLLIVNSLSNNGKKTTCLDTEG